MALVYQYIQFIKKICAVFQARYAILSLKENQLLLISVQTLLKLSQTKTGKDIVMSI